MPLALTGSLTVVQFCYPAELPLNSNKNYYFAKVSKFARLEFEAFCFAV